MPLNIPLENIFTVRSSVSFSNPSDTLSIRTKLPSAISLLKTVIVLHFSITSFNTSDFVIVTLKFSNTFSESDDPDLIPEPTSPENSFKNVKPIFASNSAFNSSC